MIIKLQDRDLPLLPCDPFGVFIDERSQRGQEGWVHVVDFRQSRQRQHRFTTRSGVCRHLRNLHQWHRLGAQLNYLAALQFPVGSTAMPDCVDTPILILEFDFLLFRVEQTTINTWIDANFPGIDHAAQAGLEQGLFRALEDIVSTRLFVAQVLCIA